MSRRSTPPFILWSLLSKAPVDDINIVTIESNSKTCHP